jgi:hypothetical protein
VPPARRDGKIVQVRPGEDNSRRGRPGQNPDSHRHTAVQADSGCLHWPHYRSFKSQALLLQTEELLCKSDALTPSLTIPTT